jgi:hypothetical protein
MLRQRIRTRTSPVVFVGRLLCFLFAVALVWYGLMTLLLAFKVSPHTINSISAYRTIFNWLARLTPGDVSGDPTRAILAGAGVFAFLLFGYLAFKDVPRAHLTRHHVQLTEDSRGEVTVTARAIERLVEIAASQDHAITTATGRYNDNEVTVTVTARTPLGLAAVLRDTQRRAADAIERHELPALPINVTLSGYDRRHRRELQ